MLTDDELGREDCGVDATARLRVRHELVHQAGPLVRPKIPRLLELPLELVHALHLELLERLHALASQHVFDLWPSVRAPSGCITPLGHCREVNDRCLRALLALISRAIQAFRGDGGQVFTLITGHQLLLAPVEVRFRHAELSVLRCVA